MILPLLLIAAVAPQEGTLECRLKVNPAEVAIGEPSVWELVVEHPSEERVELVDEDPLAGLSELERLSWVVVEGPTRDRRELAPGQVRTRFRWSVLSLEGGTRPLPALEVRAATGQGAFSDTPSLVVWNELAEEEDEARGLAPLVAVEAQKAVLRPTHVLLVLLAGVAAWFWWRRRHRPRPAPAEAGVIDARARIDAIALSLQRDAGGDAAFMHELSYELTALLRRDLEGRLGFEQPGASDEEWLARARSQAERWGTAADESARAEVGELLDELQRWLRELEPLKYGADTATPFRVEDLLQRAKGMLDRSARLSVTPATPREVAA